VDEAALAAFLEVEALPAAFRETFETVCRPLAARAQTLRDEGRRTVLLGICGAQGSGKSTIAAATCRLLAGQGASAVTLSLDDFYLSGEARRRLAREVHPLFATRGPPGTHDVSLAASVLDRLQAAGEVALPSFDKAADEPRPAAERRTVAAPADVVLLEGWCVGARPQDPAALVTPVNALEAEEDADGVWRTCVNTALAGPYQSLFARLQAVVFLAAPSFEVVAGWRAEQEAKLRARTGAGMAPGEIGRFVAHYERLTRWMLAEMPGRVALTVRLGEDRAPRLEG